MAKSNITAREIALALDWVSGKIDRAEVAKALRIKSPNNALPRLAYVLREAFKRRIIIKRGVPIRGSIS